MDFTEIIVLETLISNNILTRFEIAQILHKRISEISSGGKVYLSPDEMLIPIKGVIDNIPSGNIIIRNGINYIAITDTAELAKKELNVGKCPYLIERTIDSISSNISISDTSSVSNGNKKWVEYRNPNNMIRPIL